MPSNERRLCAAAHLRRAVYSGARFIERHLLDQVSEAVIARMERAYPDLRDRAEFTTRLLAAEEAKFRETLDRGRAVLDEILAGATKAKRVAGEQAFLLYDTFGYPLELTCEIAALQGFTVDVAEFEREMSAQRERARAAAKFEFEADRVPPTLAHLRAVIGYDRTSHATTVGSIIGPEACGKRAGGRRRRLVLIGRRSIEGGQAGDAGGHRRTPAGVTVETAQAAEGSSHRRRVVEGSVAVNDAVTAHVDPSRRASQHNHTATHLHAALRAQRARRRRAHVADIPRLRTSGDSRRNWRHSGTNEKIRGASTCTGRQPYDDAIAGGDGAVRRRYVEGAGGWDL
jgi:alanyl-tRNA synthetase